MKTKLKTKSLKWVFVSALLSGATIASSLPFIINQSSFLNNYIIQTDKTIRENNAQIDNAINIDVQTPTLTLADTPISKPIAIPQDGKESAADAFTNLTGYIGDFVDKQLFLKYVDISSFPSDVNITTKTKLTFNNVDYESTHNYRVGTIDLWFLVDKYYAEGATPDVKKEINAKQIFDVKIEKFKIVYGYPAVTLLEPTIPANIFFKNVFKGEYTKEVNRKYLGQFINLSCYPETAKLEIDKIPNKDERYLQFTLNSDQVYDLDGKTKLGNYPQDFSFDLYRGKKIDPMVITIIIGISCFLLILVFMIIYMSNRRIRYRDANN